MAKSIQEVLANALESLFGFVGDTVRFVLGLCAVVLCTSLAASGEIINDLTAYKDVPIDWLHVAALLLPLNSAAIIAYFLHNRAVATALQKTAPPEEK